MRSDACLEPPVEAAAPAVGFQYNGRLHTLRAKHVHAGVKGQPTFVDAPHAGRHTRPHASPHVPHHCDPASRACPLGTASGGVHALAIRKTMRTEAPPTTTGLFVFARSIRCRINRGIQPRFNRRFPIDETGRSNASRVVPFRSAPRSVPSPLERVVCRYIEPHQCLVAVKSGAESLQRDFACRAGPFRWRHPHDADARRHALLQPD